VGVDIPDIYYDIYSKANPHDEKVNIKSLEIILHQLSGLPFYSRQKVCYLYFLLENKPLIQKA
jgi:hypothetical protein